MMIVRTRWKLLILLAALLILTIGTSNAALIKVYGNLTPINAGSKVYIPPGSAKIIYLNATTDVDTSTVGSNTLSYYIVSGSQYYNASFEANIYIWNNTTNSWQYYESVTPKNNNTSGVITWNGPPGSYNITLNVSTSPTTPTTATGAITLVFLSYNASFTTGNVYYNISTYSLTVIPTPEILTLGLVGVGAAAILILRRKMF